MRSETPKDRVDPFAFNDASDSTDEHEHGNSMAMDLLDTPGGDGSLDILGFDSGTDGGTMLLPHERKLPVSEQRRIIAGRKHFDDGIEEDDNQAMGGRRGRGGGGRGRWRRQHGDGEQDHGSHRERRGQGGPRHAHGGVRVRGEDDIDTGSTTSGGTARGPVEKNEDAAATGSGSGGGSRIERDAEMAPATAHVDGKAPAAATRDAVRLDDPAHPHAPLYEAALRAVTELTPAQAAMGPAEQANVAAALTARMAGDAAFAQQAGDPSQLSFGLAQNGDRLFAINNSVPEAPNAVHVSVDLEQARALPLEASSRQAEAAAMTLDAAHPQQNQSQAMGSQAADPQAIEAHAREHAPRQV